MVALALGAGACQEPFREVAERIADASRSSDGAWTKLSFLTDEIGLVCLELEGKRIEIKNAIKWLEKQGVKVEPVEINVLES